MLKVQRQSKILTYLKLHGTLSISNIAKELDCSEETIRKDLIELEKQSKLIRIHGGAYIEDFNDRGIEIEIRETLLRDEKIYISKIAVKKIVDKNTIMLDSSTTCIELMKRIIENKLNVRVITNSLGIASLCRDNDKINLILIGGEYKKKTNSLNGYHTTEVLNKYYADYSFVSYPTVNLTRGVGDNNWGDLKIRDLMIQNSKHKILLLDHTKFSTETSIVFSSFPQVEEIITDKNPSEKWKKFLNDRSIKLSY